MNNKQLSVLLFALFVFAFTAANATASTERIAKEDFTKFVDDFEAPTGEDYLPSLYNALVKEYPQYDWDLWELYVSGYPSADNSRGFKSVYVNEDGKVTTPACGVNKDPIKSHKGDEVKEEDQLVTESREVIKNGVENELTLTYEDLGKALDDYEGKLSCSSKKCAKALSKYLENGGWDTEVVKKAWKGVNNGKKAYGVLVTTEDEGDVYIILG